MSLLHSHRTFGCGSFSTGANILFTVAAHEEEEFLFRMNHFFYFLVLFFSFLAVSQCGKRRQKEKIQVGKKGMLHLSLIL